MEKPVLKTANFVWEAGKIRVKCNHGFGITSFNLEQGRAALKELERAIKQGEKEEAKK